ncbi:hypothetical protein BAE44_0008102 [Dichanthelium oligosanthes]|uniref:Uncharacterized protein n=1 Tax=Dichanthelium oligosanthes TaxID=888268 RepID=A0A1E5W0H4_9POAL|nr:hypothetical protein BAE44_0008102 [Dichanthelium oligosanthes]
MIRYVLNFFPTTTLKRIKDTENIPKYTFIKVTPAAHEYRPVENNKVLNFLPTTTLKRIKDTENIPMYSLYVIRVVAHIGPLEETRTSSGLTKIHDIVLMIE